MPSLIEIGLLVLEKKIFIHIYTWCIKIGIVLTLHINMVFPIVAPPDPRGL